MSKTPRAYADPTADRAIGRLERWLKEKKAREALRTRHEPVIPNPQQGERNV